MPKYFYKLELCYQGTHFLGFQRQIENQRTVQGELEKALLKINKGSEVSSLGSGRTDSGVHALGQIVKIGLDFDIPESDLKKAINGLLPWDIYVKNLTTCEESFHPVFMAKSKEYIYVFKASSLDPYTYNLIGPAPLNLNFDRIKEALALLIGEHDFVNFQCVGTPVKSSVRKIFAAQLLTHQEFDLGQMVLKDVHLLRFHGSGFLKQMIRLLVGALFQVGLGKVSIEKFKESLEFKMEQRLGNVAPGQGLYLNQVFYE